MSDKKTHTPGPWRIDASYPTVDVVTGGVTVCQVLSTGGWDRHLIAAAPDLLAACEAVLDRSEWLDARDRNVCSLCRTIMDHDSVCPIPAARAAVAKAGGEP